MVDGRDLVRRYIDEVFNRGNLDAIPQFLAGETFIAGVVELVNRWRTAFPDFHEEVEDAYQDGDQVIAVSALSGTHRGVLQSQIGLIQPTGREARWSRIAIRLLDGDHFVDGFFEEDEVGLLKQLGAVTEMRESADRGRHSPLAEVEGR